jgi:hypothetical protein
MSRGIERIPNVVSSVAIKAERRNMGLMARDCTRMAGENGGFGI